MTPPAETGTSARGLRPRQRSSEGRRAGEGRGRTGAQVVEAALQSSGAAPLLESIEAQHQLAHAILIFIYIVWFALMAAGCAAYAGHPPRVKPRHLPLSGFDAVFRRAGSLMLPALWACRAATSLALPALVDPGANLVWTPGALYAGQAALRMAIYALHYAGYLFPLAHRAPGQLQQPHHPEHAMSDHILLAAMVVGGAASEAVLPLLNWWHAQRRRGAGAAVLAAAHSGAAVALAVLVAGEAYFTARYFHPPGEIVCAVILGLLLFQAPLLAYCHQALRLQRARVTGLALRGLEKGPPGAGAEPAVAAAAAVAGANWEEESKVEEEVEEEEVGNEEGAAAAVTAVAADAHEGHPRGKRRRPAPAARG